MNDNILGQPYQCSNPDCYAWLVSGQQHKIPEDCRRHHDKHLKGIRKTFDRLVGDEQ